MYYWDLRGSTEHVYIIIYSGCTCSDGEGVGAGGGKTPVASEGLPNSSSSLQLTHSNAASQLGSTSVTDQQSDAQRERKDRESHATTSESFELKAEEEEGEGGGGKEGERHHHYHHGDVPDGSVTVSVAYICTRKNALSDMLCCGWSYRNIIV